MSSFFNKRFLQYCIASLYDETNMISTNQFYNVLSACVSLSLSKTVPQRICTIPPLSFPADNRQRTLRPLAFSHSCPLSSETTWMHALWLVLPVHHGTSLSTNHRSSACILIGPFWFTTAHHGHDPLICLKFGPIRGRSYRPPIPHYYSSTRGCDTLWLGLTNGDRSSNKKSVSILLQTMLLRSKMISLILPAGMWSL